MINTSPIKGAELYNPKCMSESVIVDELAPTPSDLSLHDKRIDAQLFPSSGKIFVLPFHTVARKELLKTSFCF